MTKLKGKNDEASANSDGSWMDEEDDKDNLENSEQALDISVPTKVVTRPHKKRTVARSQLPAINKLASGTQERARVNAKASQSWKPRPTAIAGI